MMRKETGKKKMTEERDMSRNKISRDLMHNLDYIKNQNNDILRSLCATKNNSSSINLKDLTINFQKK